MYATLIFIFVVDQSESELGILDLIHVMVSCSARRCNWNAVMFLQVEAFDHVFENVCELDLIFHTDKVRGIYE